MGQSLRPSYWTTDHISFLQYRGYWWDLSPLEQLYNLQEISKAGETDSTKVRVEARYRGMSDGFKNCIWRFLQMMPRRDESLLFWLQSENDYYYGESQDYYAGRQRGTIGMRVRPWLEVYDTFILDNRLDEDPNYLGKTQGGYTSYSEQAYALVSYKGFRFKLGRDFIRWGTGRDASLLVSDFSRPMDQFAASYKSHFFKFSYFTASLNPSDYAVEGLGGTGYPLLYDRQNRYLTAHRLEIRPWRYLYVAISEAILFGGPNYSYDFAYLNPFIFYHGVQLNGPNGGNTIGSLSLAFIPKPGIFLYGDLLIDDMQLEKTGPGDLEPNEIGYIVGANVADPFGIFGLDLYGEYTRITNRTYNTLQPWEKWLHRNQPIGHFLGNDFDRILAGFSYWPKPVYRFSFGYEKRRRGGGRIEKPFDSPWQDVPIGEEYHEPFPTGVVEKSNIYRLEATWHPWWWLRCIGMISYWDVENLNNMSGENIEYWEGFFRVEVDWIGRWRLGIKK